MGKSINKDCICTDDTRTPEEKWEYMYGTTAFGNLPQHKKHEHVGYKWQPCPYSTQASDSRTRALLGLEDADPLPSKVDHTNSTTGKVHYMNRDRRGSWGFFCTSDDCPYFITNGIRYFFR